MVKFFEYIDGHDLENAINEWLSKNEYLLLDIKYNTRFFESSVWHYAIITYKVKENNNLSS